MAYNSYSRWAKAVWGTEFDEVTVYQTTNKTIIRSEKQKMYPECFWGQTFAEFGETGPRNRGHQPPSEDGRSGTKHSLRDHQRPVWL